MHTDDTAFVVLRVCRQCGTEFSVPRSQLKRRKAEYCSYTCRGLGVSAPLADRFYAKVSKTATCWEWTAYRDNAGYGRFSTNGTGTNVLATHIAWKLATGEMPPAGFWVLHTCDRPPCVRNDDEGVYVINGIVRPRRGHLWLGTDADNSADKIEKGRAPTSEARSSVMRVVSPRGEANPRAILTATQVIEIRTRHAAGGVTQRQLALAFHVDPSTISDIVRRRNWRHL